MAFVVENKAGANGIPAVRELSRSAPDGYTLLVGNINSNGLAPALHHKKYGFDVKTAIQPVTLLSDGPSALVASRSQPAGYKENLQLWKTHPGKFAYFAAGVGSFGHIWFAKLTEREGLDLLFVPVKGGGEGLQLMYEGSVQYAYVPAASFVGQIRKGEMRALFVTGGHRLPEIPDVPTLREVGLPEDFEINTWVGLFAPSRMKPELLQRIHRPLRRRRRQGGSGSTVQGHVHAAAGEQVARRVLEVRGEPDRRLQNHRGTQPNQCRGLTRALCPTEHWQ